MSIQKIAVFGSARPKSGDLDYGEAEHLGRLLGQAGYIVLTGGYMGTMEAVSRGASEAGGHVIGVTCDELEAWRPVSHNRWVKEEMRFPRLRDRLLALIDECDAALALPGGPGTLTEVSMMWNQLLIQAIPARPLILIGPGWKVAFETMYQVLGSYIGESERSWLSFAENVEAAFQLLQSGNDRLEKHGL